jgi:hypothetical protein
MLSEITRLKETIARYERGLKAIRDCEETGVDFGDWVQATVEDLLDGEEAECPRCGTIVHEGACVSEEVE